MQLFLLGVSHRTAPVDLRERLDFSSRGVDQALTTVAARGVTREAVIVSTCNRAEIYVACEDVPAARRDLLEFIGEFHGVSIDQLAPHLYERTDGDVARHLFRVAAGLDSLVVGEPQILGQVKEAFNVATAQRCTGPLINRLFHSAFGVGKRVRSETALAEGAVSVSYAAVALARKIFGDLKGRRVLVIGAGEMGKLTVQHLKAQGIERITITSRTRAHADALAETFRGTAIPWETMVPALAESDIVITATGSLVPILSRAAIEMVMRSHRGRQPLFIIDIAVPRDVDPAAGELEQVFLYNIDDLQALVQANLSRRTAEVDNAEAIVGEETDRFLQWVRSRGTVPTVVALRQRFESIRRSELRRLEPKMSTLSPDARARVDEITRLLVEKLLLQPTEQLKAIGDPEATTTYTEALTRLFALASEIPGPIDATPPARDEGEPVPRPAASVAKGSGRS